MVTPSQWKRVVSPRLPPTDTWAFKGKLCFRADPRWVAVGLHGDGSGFHTDSVYVSIARIPLFIPSDVLDLSFSTRISAGGTFGVDELATSPQLGTAIASIPQEQDALETLVAFPSQVPRNVRTSETVAYAHLLLGDENRADQLLATVTAEPSDPDWVRDVASRAMTVRELLATRGPEAATEQLSAWRDHTVRSLRLH